MNTANHQFPKALPKYRAKDAVNRRLREPTFDEAMVANAVKGLVKSLEAIDSKISVEACAIYLTKNDYQVMRIT